MVYKESNKQLFQHTSTIDSAVCSTYPFIELQQKEYVFWSLYSIWYKLYTFADYFIANVTQNRVCDSMYGSVSQEGGNK